MKTVAIITEYNPFHAGHAWQLQAARARFGQDCAIIVAMSGCFVQRGEPAILDKWSRTRMALACGVDLVIELPFLYASASAERFASGGVQLIQAAGLDCHLAFGSESGDLEQLEQLAAILADESPEFRRHLHEGLDLGDSFPAARQKAVEAVTGQTSLAALLAESNNILAVEYLKAIRKTPACRLAPITFQRQGQAYRDLSPEQQAGNCASASAIRQRILERCGKWQPAGQRWPDFPGLLRDLGGVMPAPALAILLEQLQGGIGPVFPEDLAVPILAQLRSRPVSQIEQIPGMGEGLGRRLAAAAARPDKTEASGRLGVLLHDAATRRFPQTRIQRALLSLLADLQAEDLAASDAAGGPQYLRVLGFSRKGRYLLKIMRRLAEKPIIMKASDFLEYKDPALVRMAGLDILATDLWMLAAGRPCGADFDTPVVMG